MILSASRRTDIPAWYGAWFLNKLRRALPLVPNPYAENLHMLRKFRSPDVVDCIVFWSKTYGRFSIFLPETNWAIPSIFSSHSTPMKRRLNRISPLWMSELIRFTA